MHYPYNSYWIATSMCASKIVVYFIKSIARWGGLPISQSLAERMETQGILSLLSHGTRQTSPLSNAVVPQYLCTSMQGSQARPKLKMIFVCRLESSDSHIEDLTKDTKRALLIGKAEDMRAERQQTSSLLCRHPGRRPVRKAQKPLKLKLYWLDTISNLDFSTSVEHITKVSL